MIELINQISNLYFGLLTDKMFMVLGSRAYSGLTPAYLKVIGSQAQLKSIVNGELYENTAPVSKGFHFVNCNMKCSGLFAIIITSIK